MKKIYQLLLSPQALTIIWVIFLCSPILGVLRLKFLINPSLNTFHINGLSSVIYYFPYLLSIIALLIIVLRFVAFTKGKLISESKYNMWFISLLTIGFLVVSQILINSEYSEYPNYLYSRFGITINQLKSMSFVASLQVMVFISLSVYKMSLYNKLKTTAETLPRYKIPFYISTVGILCLFAMSLATLTDWRILSREAGEGYEGKVGIDYKYIELIQKNAPESAQVIHPPQGDKWPAIGNQPVLRYFLYPRTLISGALLTNNEISAEIMSAIFVVIDKDGSRNWPLIDIKNKKISFNESNYINYNSLSVIFENNISTLYLVKF